MFDIGLVGHVTKDTLTAGRAEKVTPGGASFYAAITLRSLGARVSVVTKLNRHDASLLDELRARDVAVSVTDSASTTTFLNAYPDNPDLRRQLVADVASPFTEGEVSNLEADLYYLGPLTNKDIPAGVVRFLAGKGPVALDVQGFTRRIDRTGERWDLVTQADWHEKALVLPHVSIVKANEEEARVLTGDSRPIRMAELLSEYGPDEVIITRGSKPALLRARGKSYWIPSYPPQAVVDPTGSGDTFMAAYLFYRRLTDSVEEAGKFAAMTASLKLGVIGPFTGTLGDVREFAVSVGSPIGPS